MTKQLYLVPLPDVQTDRPPQSRTSARVPTAGLIQEAGSVAERVALEGVDVQLNGRIQWAEFSKKIDRELKSLAESDYTALPFADMADPDSDEQAGYYEFRTQDDNGAHQTSDLAYQYTLGLEFKGTRETHWRSVPTKVENVNTGLATSGNGLIGVPTEATKVRWYDDVGGSGTEVASVDATVNAEYGDVDNYDPSAASFDDPTLIYELPFDREGPVDVRVWDDIGEANKFASYDDAQNTTYEITQWVHAYHPAFEFEGTPITDNGLLRMQFDESAGQIDADEWDEATTSWTDLATVGGSTEDYELFDADFRAYSPAEVKIFAEWQDTSDDSIHATVLKSERGNDRAVLRQPDNGTIPSDLETMLSPIVSSQTTDAQPSQEVEARGDL